MWNTQHGQDKLNIYILFKGANILITFCSELK